MVHVGLVRFVTFLSGTTLRTASANDGRPLASGAKSHVCRLVPGLPLDDVAASGSLALEGDKAGYMFCIEYVRSCMLVFHQCNNLRIGDIPRHPGHGERHGRDGPPEGLWKASALWWLGRSGCASIYGCRGH